MSRGIAKVILLGVPVLALLGLFVAGLMRWRESANRIRCQDNLRRVGWFAMWQYTDREFAFPKGVDMADRARVLREDLRPDSNRSFPPGTVPNPALPPERRLAWNVLLLPHLGRDDVYQKFALTKAWDDDANRDAVLSRMPVLACPTLYTTPPAGSAQTTPYIGMAGLGTDAPRLPPTDPRAGFFRYDEPTKTGMLRRGYSHTITILESERDLGPWPAGGPPTVRGLDTNETPYIGPGWQFGTHPAGCNAAFADGSVRFQARSISPRVLETLVILREHEP